MICYLMDNQNIFDNFWKCHCHSIHCNFLFQGFFHFLNKERWFITPLLQNNGVITQQGEVL